jgi:hypothetical protein
LLGNLSATFGKLDDVVHGLRDWLIFDIDRGMVAIHNWIAPDTGLSGVEPGAVRSSRPDTEYDRGQINNTSFLSAVGCGISWRRVYVIGQAGM